MATLLSSRTLMLNGSSITTSIPSGSAWMLELGRSGTGSVFLATRQRFRRRTIEDAPRWMQGCFTRRGETRAVKSADSWMESFQRRLNEI